MRKRNFRELDTVCVVSDAISTRPMGEIHRRSVPKGTFGSVLHIHENGIAFAVEIPALHGGGTDVVTLWASDIEPSPPPPDPKDIEIEHLRALLDERWKDSANIYLKHAGPAGDGRFEMALQSPIFALFAEHTAATFKANGGENYVVFELGHKDIGTLLLTMQRRLGKHPAQIASEARKELEDAKTSHASEMKRLKDGLARLANSGGGHTSVMAACLLHEGSLPLLESDYEAAQRAYAWELKQRQTKAHQSVSATGADAKQDTKPALPSRIQCATPDQSCDCPPECCNNEIVFPITCHKCGITAVAFICSERGCPVNGARRNNTLAEDTKKRELHYGDPPNVGCCSGGATMNSEPRRVLEN